MALKTRVAKLEALVEAKQRVLRNPLKRESQEVRYALHDTYTWVTGHTETYNEHWIEEGRPSAYERFPQYEYLRFVFECLESDERIWWFEKSRDMMLTWACVAYLTKQAMEVDQRSILLQTQKEKKAVQLVRYAKTLYSRQDKILREAYPLTKPVDQQPALELHFASGSSIIGIPGGADQIRSYHPWGYLNDESSFQPEAGECYNEALSAVAGKIIFNSSAGPGWYADARHDVIQGDDG